MMDRHYFTRGGSSLVMDRHNNTFGGFTLATNVPGISAGSSSEAVNRHYAQSGVSTGVNMYSWYFTKEEIECNSPSRRDGISLKLEENIRRLYCSFIRDIGIRLGLPQLTIATAMIFCHRFFLHQSHARNGWETMATVCVFLASKVEDTVVALDEVVKVAYETLFQRDPPAAWQICQKDVFQRQKALILVAENLLLTTIRFDFNIQHAYRPLLDAMNKLGITHIDVRQAAWNFVNHWVQTTLCIQYKPNYIAAGSLFLAFEVSNLNLPMGKEYMWWHEFDVNPKLLCAVIHQMSEMLGLKQLPIAAAVDSGEGKRASYLYSSPDSVLRGLHIIQQ